MQPTLRYITHKLIGMGLVGFANGARFGRNLGDNDAGDDDDNANGFAPGEGFLADKDGGNERKDRDGVGEYAGRGGTQMLNSHIVEDVGHRAAKDTEDHQ